MNKNALDWAFECLAYQQANKCTRELCNTFARAD